MEKVIFTIAVRSYFDLLIFSLFHKNYFSHIENAKQYVDKIIDFILSEILYFPHKKTPFSLKHFGEFYILVDSNQRTTWDIFFEKRKNKYIIPYFEQPLRGSAVFVKF